MSETERVINDLNVAKLTLCNPQMLTPEMCVRIGHAVTNAIGLLKAQEPRVLNIVELKNFAVIWFEARNHLYIEPMLTRGKNFADESTDWFRYGKEWRCWTSKPTIEQQKEAKWDEG